MKKFQNVIVALIFAIVGGFTAVVIYRSIEKPQVITLNEDKPVQFASFSSQGGGVDLTVAAEISVKSVVNIQTQYKSNGSYSSGNPFFDFFFGDRNFYEQPQIQQATGSGVIITPDGYIVTNNHVIENSDKIRIKLYDNREYDAKLIGTDPNTDIALIKVEGENFPAIRWGNSDALKLGEWVLAVGNPFNLTSTVTAGIVSAKSRGIGIISGQLPIESFIQTDAAVNPGNSGGALVNTQGELVGINTAIASRTGSYSGYSFAVPVSIVRKVVDDIKQFGEVQRAVLGVNIQDVDDALAKEFDLDDVNGVYVASVVENGAAEECGIKKGDVIISIEGVKVNTRSELQEQISKHRPGDVVKVLAKRDNKEKLFTATLRNTRGGTGIVKDQDTIMGAELAKLDETVKSKLGLRNGVQVTDLKDGKIKNAGIRKGFIITYVNKTPVYSVEDINQIIQKSSGGGVLFEGVYPNGEEAYYVFGLK
ncbi:MAG: Do family serine endopeptidase [Prolixibacteraceae bacterium]|nr:Do family serine endopeptidase [Prolixibacteraceae bacterium]